MAPHCVWSGQHSGFKGETVSLCYCCFSILSPLKKKINHFIEISLVFPTIHPFMVCNSMALSIFRILLPSPQSFLGAFRYPKETLQSPLAFTCPQVPIAPHSQDPPRSAFCLHGLASSRGFTNVEPYNMWSSSGTGFLDTTDCTHSCISTSCLFMDQKHTVHCVNVASA